MVFKNSFTLLVATRTTPFFVVVPIFFSTIVANSYITENQSEDGSTQREPKISYKFFLYI